MTDLADVLSTKVSVDLHAAHGDNISALTESLGALERLLKGEVSEEVTNRKADVNQVRAVASQNTEDLSTLASCAAAGVSYLALSLTSAYRFTVY